MPLKGLTNKTPSGFAGVGLLEGEPAGVEVAPTGDGDVAAPLPGNVQAPASKATARTSAPPRPDLLISKGNSTLRSGLRFRYDPATEAGHRPSPPGLSSKGSRLRRMASGYPFLFYLIELEE